ncbi:MAG: hypothetical protein U5Q44_10765 [Dehalococcoidia bacterium]|nr:hypothetical protein [Dehalococcoidia bacterium]
MAALARRAQQVDAGGLRERDEVGVEAEDVAAAEGRRYQRVGVVDDGRALVLPGEEALEGVVLEVGLDGDDAAVGDGVPEEELHGGGFAPARDGEGFVERPGGGDELDARARGARAMMARSSAPHWSRATARVTHAEASTKTRISGDHTGPVPRRHAASPPR